MKKMIVIAALALAACAGAGSPPPVCSMQIDAATFACSTDAGPIAPACQGTRCTCGFPCCRGSDGQDRTGVLTYDVVDGAPRIVSLSSEGC